MSLWILPQADVTMRIFSISVRWPRAVEPEIGTTEGWPVQTVPLQTSFTGFIHLDFFYRLHPSYEYVNMFSMDAPILPPTNMGCIYLYPWASKAGGDGGTRPPQSKYQRGMGAIWHIQSVRPKTPISSKYQRETFPRNDDIWASFFLKYRYENFAFSNLFRMKWPKSEEKLTFEGGWAGVPMNPSPQTNFVATPLPLPLIVQLYLPW